MFSRHVTKDISAYCHGELSSEASKQFAEHIISCVKCRSRFEEIKLGIKLAERLPQLSAPDHLWSGLEPLLANPQITQSERVTIRGWSWQLKAAAVVLLLVSSLVALSVYKKRFNPPSFKSGEPYWQVTRLDGTPMIGKEAISNNGQLAVGEWLETDGKSKAQIAVSSIGNVDIDENTRVRLLETHDTEHRLELARGKMSARIWAPPRLFFVDTPSAVAADLGCAYTLEVDDHGASKLQVTSGWVALELKDRESMVPAGASCETRPVVGPGTPYFNDSSTEFRAELSKVDFDPDAAARSAALKVMLDDARPKDTLTLWHLLTRVDGNDRARVFEKMATLSPPPAGVTREGVLQLNQTMLEAWRDDLKLTWMGVGKGVPKPIAEAYWRAKNGLSRRLKEMAPK
ncbi:MAG TPA: FecR domain-containing protein [Pyrinomonadaceae bacterium]|nr:FecR domain-containing protein [Pyrinomonadaceae bacterium]